MLNRRRRMIVCVCETKRKSLGVCGYCGLYMSMVCWTLTNMPTYANADINAAVNLASKFFGLWRKVNQKDWKYIWKENGQTREFDAKSSFEEWAAAAKHRQQLRDAPF